MGGFNFSTEDKILRYIFRGDTIYDVIIPDNCDKTLAEMSDEERRNRNDGHTSATELFAEWYKNTYLKQCVKKLSLS